MGNSNDPAALVAMLYEIALDAEAPASSRLSAIKEILDRTVGKGTLLEDGQPSPEGGEIVFRMEEPPDTT